MSHEIAHVETGFNVIETQDFYFSRPTESPYGFCHTEQFLIVNEFCIHDLWRIVRLAKRAQ